MTSSGESRRCLDLTGDCSRLRKAKDSVKEVKRERGKREKEGGQRREQSKGEEGRRKGSAVSS